MKTVRLTIAVSLFLLPAAAFGQSPADASLTTNPVFQQNCAKCHGKNAEGKHFGGPSLISAKTAAIPTDHLRSIITNGKGHMPRYTGKLSAEQIDTLVQQIVALNQK